MTVNVSHLEWLRLTSKPKNAPAIFLQGLDVYKVFSLKILHEYYININNLEDTSRTLSIEMEIVEAWNMRIEVDRTVWRHYKKEGVYINDSRLDDLFAERMGCANWIVFLFKLNLRSLPINGAYIILK